MQRECEGKILGFHSISFSCEKRRENWLKENNSSTFCFHSISFSCEKRLEDFILDNYQRPVVSIQLVSLARRDSLFTQKDNTKEVKFPFN